MGALSALLQHPEEVPALLRLRYAAYTATWLPKDADLAFCYDMLNRVSRSFAVVIQQLGTELRDAICIFYLVLRGLDTVEDDMEVPVATKLPILNTFHKHIYNPSWKFVCGTKDYKRLMMEFQHVSNSFLALKPEYKKVIEEITRKMGEGMAKFIVKEVETVEDYDEYCHYVAGLVGLGLSDLFAASGLEETASETLSNSMGLFLQKTNIIRDYLEDITEEPAPRMFWPKEIWGKYASKLEDFKSPPPGEARAAVSCLNALVTDALRHADDSLTYMAKLKNNAVFRFCAIPQVMAVGTLALCYNNEEVFRGVVKMRRGQTAWYIDRTKRMDDVYSAFNDFAAMMAAKVDETDPNAQLTLDRLETIKRRCRTASLAVKSVEGTLEKVQKSNVLLLQGLWWILALSVAFAFWAPHVRTYKPEGEAGGRVLDRQDKAQQVIAVLLLAGVTAWLLLRQRP